MTARKHNVSTLLYPNSIAITGASQNPEDLGSYILRNIVFSSYKGKVFPISNTISKLYDFDTYSGIKEIREDIDLAIIAVPADRVIDDVSDCTKAKVKNICIVSRGFAETGARGIALQKRIVKMAQEAGINVLGPNSLGIISTAKNLNATFSPISEESLSAKNMSNSKGRTVFLSQSGALINALLEYSDFYSLDLAEVIGLGNKADINEIDLLEYYGSLRQDGRPHVIGAYLENISDGKRYLDIARNFTSKIPLVCLIPSESPKTREYIYTHSGSILQDDEVIDLALQETGAIKVYTQQELYDLMLAFSWQIVPRGDRVAVISNAGGGLILAIEQLYRSGLKLVNFSTEVKKLLTSEIDWKGQNPGVVDLGGQALSLSYLKALDIVLGDHDVNSVIVVLSTQVMTQIEESAEVIGRLAKEHGKTVVAAFMGYEGVERGLQSLARYYVPAFKTVDRAVFVLSKMHEYSKRKEQGGNVLSRYSNIKALDKRRSSMILTMIEEARMKKFLELNKRQCDRILDDYGVATADSQLVSSLQACLKFSKEYGFPVKFYCPKNDKGELAYDKHQLKKVYTSHFASKANGEEHMKEEHIIKKVYNSKRKFVVQIVKDNYYKHRDKGFMMKDLALLSFGYHMSLASDNCNLEAPVEALLPLSRDEIEEMLRNSRLLDSMGIKPKDKYNDLIKTIGRFMISVSKIPQDFHQVLSLKLYCIARQGKIIVSNSEIKLDLIG